MDTQSVLLNNLGKIELDVPILILMIVLIILSAFFSMTETAFSSVSVIKLKSMVEDQKRGAKKALTLAEDFDKTVTTLLIGNNIVNTALSTIAVGFFAKLIVDQEWVSLISTVVITLSLLIFGEVLPKTFGKNHPESIAVKFSFLVFIFSIIFWPLGFVLRQLQKLIGRKNQPEDSTLDEEELGILIDEMEENGAIEDDEAAIIKNVFDLKDRNVCDIMVPRIEMVALDYNSKLEEVKQFLLEKYKYSRIPVFKKDKDHIVGILYVRDFFPAYIKNSRLAWKRLLRPVKFVSGQMKADDLIVEFQKSKSHMAIVSGEYGDVLGLVTMEDALEELVGEIYDETDVAGEDDLLFEQQPDGSYLVDSEMYVEDLFEKLNIGDVPVDVPSKLSGWLFARCESIPKVDFEIKYVAIYTMYDEEKDSYEDYYKTLLISIAEVDGRRIHKVRVVVRDATAEEIAERERLDE